MKTFNPFLLNNKTILITGASSGIGASTAKLCSELGASVICVGRNYNRLWETFSQLNPNIKNFLFNIDINSDIEVADMVTKLRDLDLKIDGIVNCAGISKTLPLGSSNLNAFQDSMNTNVFAGLNIVRYLSKSVFLPAGGASYVFISSAVAHSGAPGRAIYTASKGALVSMTRALAIELSPRNVRINSISPGVILTPMAELSPFRRTLDSMTDIHDRYPLGLGSPADVANGCVYLLSDASRWVTGIDLRIDGGFTAQ